MADGTQEGKRAACQADPGEREEIESLLTSSHPAYLMVPSLDQPHVVVVDMRHSAPGVYPTYPTVPGYPAAPQQVALPTDITYAPAPMAPPAPYPGAYPPGVYPPGAAVYPPIYPSAPIPPVATPYPPAAAYPSAPPAPHDPAAYPPV